MHAQGPKRRIVPVLAIALAITPSLGISGCDGGEPELAPPDSGQNAAPDGRALVDSKCSMCHTLDRVYSAQKTRSEWVDTMNRMKTNGLVVTDDEFDRIVEFLSQE